MVVDGKELNDKTAKETYRLTFNGEGREGLLLVLNRDKS
jgi:hypothetical protein